MTRADIRDIIGLFWFLMPEEKERPYPAVAEDAIRIFQINQRLRKNYEDQCSGHPGRGRSYSQVDYKHLEPYWAAWEAKLEPAADKLEAKIRALVPETIAVEFQHDPRGRSLILKKADKELQV